MARLRHCILKPMPASHVHAMNEATDRRVAVGATPLNASRILGGVLLRSASKSNVGLVEMN